MCLFSKVFHIYDHGFRLAKASFLAELGLVLRSKIAIASMAKATKRRLKDLSFKLSTCDMSKIPFAEKIPKVSATQESPRSGGEKTG